MPTLNIGGKRVKVDDSFLSLSPDQQQSAVDEIVGQLELATPAQQPQANSGDTPEMAARRRQGLSPEVPAFNPGVDDYDPATGNRDPLGTPGAFLASMGEGVPIIGPAIDWAGKSMGAAAASLKTGDPYSKVRARIEGDVNQAREDHPVAHVAGNVAGGLAVLGPLGATESGGWALGVNGPSLAGRMGMSMLSGGGISAADTAVRGGDFNDVLKSGAIGGGLGAAFPLVGAGLSKGIGAGADYIGGMLNPAREAARRVGVAAKRDAGSGFTPADETVAQTNNIPLTNADRGGETVRALARSAANQSPEARASIENTASDRFAGQSQRATAFVRRLTGGTVDDLAVQDAIRDTARKVNKPAYDAAFAAPEAQAMWSPEMQQLMQAPAMQRAALQSTTRGANRAAVEGFQAIKNPFHQASDGTFKLRQKADGTLAVPTLQFWDQVKRNLDGMIGKAQRSGDKTLMADMTALKTQLVKNLDTAVPQYKTARQGAAAFFGAEDALDAGRKFATSPRAIPEAQRALAKFNGAEKKAFQAGFASELIDRIKASPDRMNVINSVFKSQAAREQMQMVFGPHKVKEIEAYVRVEGLVDQLRGAMGNSTTARQLVELGIGGAGGYAVTGDWKGALAGAALVRGPRYVKGQIEQQVMKEVGRLLIKDDPVLMVRLVHNATVSPKYMQALESVTKALQISGQAATPKVSQ